MAGLGCSTCSLQVPSLHAPPSRRPLLPWRAQGKAVVQVASGRYHSVAVTSDGKLYTWGLNDWGQLGRPATIVGTNDGCTQGSSCGGSTAGLVKDLEGEGQP